ncbi:sex peptide receptor-related protein 2-like isoform X3 [Physella acuta]|uniref:sex peptide receptor-related protein 2-like isoform X3 n=1 Tax=Physella acuta TaxID=109671 RepID=UPI0027DC680C|nr:sex peptide receptor-related protein 2-like isoform X3 [Physella acuta]
MDGMTNDPFGAMLKEFLDSQDNMSSTEDTTFTSMISTIDITEQMKDKQIIGIANGINKYYLWVLASIGVPANLLVILTILTMQVVSPVTFFIAVLAFSDGSALVLKLIFNQMSRTLMVTKVVCKLNFLPIFMSSLANWMLALICAERFISVCFPLKKMYLVTKRRGYVAVLVTALMLLAIFMFFFLYMYQISYGHCTVAEGFAWVWANIFYWINATLTVFLPFVIILTSTCFTIRGIYLSRSSRRKEDVEKSEINESSNKLSERLIAEAEKVELTITIMMVVASVLFLTLTLPSCVFFLSIPYAEASTQKGAKYVLFREIQYLLYDASHAINFFLYFCTAKSFRRQFCRLLLCDWLRRRFGKSRATDESGEIGDTQQGTTSGSVTQE